MRLKITHKMQYKLLKIFSEMRCHNHNHNFVNTITKSVVPMFTDDVNVNCILRYHIITALFIILRRRM